MAALAAARIDMLRFSAGDESSQREGTTRVLAGWTP